MQTDRPLDGIDSRFALIAYAAVMWPVGVFTMLWGSFWMDGALNGVPFGVNSLTRIAGALIIAFACAGTAAARISDPVDRWRCLAWLGHGHGVVAIVAMLQAFTVGPDQLGSPIVLALMLPAVWLGHASQKRDGDGPAGVLPMRRFRKIEDRRLRSAYEDSIRKAAIQEERSRLARDLHDSIKQQLFVVQTSAATAQARLETNIPEAGAALLQIRDSARDALTEMDSMLDQLRVTPLENAGLVSALQKLAEATSIRTGIDVRCEVGDLPPGDTLPPGTHADLLRIAQEALSNVARHARAAHVVLTLGRQETALVLRVDDDGKGFDESKEQRGMGLRNMKERASQLGGGLSLTSAQGKGTSIVVAVPMALPHRRGYSWKILSSVVFLTGSVGLVVFDTVTGRTGGGVRLGMLPVALASAINLVRYLYAWHKSRRLSLIAA